MITTTYTCDRCKATQDTDKQFWKVGAACWQSTQHAPGTFDWKFMHVCRSCAEIMGFLPGDAKKQDPAVEPPTLEDIIREIVQNEIYNTR